MDLAMIAAGALSGGLGAMLAPSSGNNSAALLDQYNNYLNGALNKALGYSTNYTNQGVAQEKQGLTTATNALNQGQSNAAAQLIPYTNQAFNIGQGLLSTYRNAGYAANSALGASLGLGSIPTAQDANQQALAQQAALLNFQLTGNQTTAPTNPGTAPVNNVGDISSYLSQITPQQVQAFFNQNTAIDPQNKNILRFNGGGLTSDIKNSPTASQQLLQQESPGIQQYLAQQAYNQANSTYQNQLNSYNSNLNNWNQYQNFINTTGYNPNYTPSTTQSNQQASQSGLQNFLNSPEYQALFGTQAANQMAQNGTYDPVQAFQQNPGTQFAIQQGIKAQNMSDASKGLLGSGANEQAITQYVSGLQNQQYQNYQNQLASTFGQYQNQLAGMTTLGSQLTGANTAASLYSGLGNTLASNAFNTGQGIANANLSTSNDITSLLANQGVLGANAYLNTGAAQANGLLNIAGMNTQQNAAQASSNAQTQSSMLNNQAALQALQYLNPQGSSINSGYGTTTNYGNGQSTYTGNPWGSFGALTGGQY